MMIMIKMTGSRGVGAVWGRRLWVKLYYNSSYYPTINFIIIIMVKLKKSSSIIIKLYIILYIF